MQTSAGGNVIVGEHVRDELADLLGSVLSGKIRRLETVSFDLKRPAGFHIRLKTREFRRCKMVRQVAHVEEGLMELFDAWD
jgi:hypothetical protein